MFLHLLTGIYLQNRTQLLLTSTCSDWFQKAGARLALQTFLDLFRKSCGEQIAASTYFCFPVVLVAVKFDRLLIGTVAHWSLLPAFSWSSLEKIQLEAASGAAGAVV